jgi:hypothetical protein
VGGASTLLKEHDDLATSVLVGQIRSPAVDLLRASGMALTEALQAVSQASEADPKE